LEYRTPGTAVVPVPRLWVVCLLVFVQFTGAVFGRGYWSTFFNGKDPQVELARANFAGFILLGVLCVLWRKRLSRFRLFDTLLAFFLGLSSSAAGMAWGVANGYGG
jgi:hypothetical protein